jgi:class 3 adenylate cyclase
MAESRHLAAIIFIDIVGFTSMMAASEEKAKTTVKNFKKGAQPIVEEFEGTWHKDLADGALCSFTSAKSAVLAAIHSSKLIPIPFQKLP